MMKVLNLFKKGAKAPIAEQNHASQEQKQDVVSDPPAHPRSKLRPDSSPRKLPYHTVSDDDVFQLHPKRR